MTDKERFWKKVNINDIDRCWEWLGCISLGYGHFSLNKKMIGAHRVSWILIHGDIPEGFDVLHKCDNKSCVNPNHLYLGTQADNNRDTVSRQYSKIQYKKKVSV
jgi:hypothetical protein